MAFILRLLLITKSDNRAISRYIKTTSWFPNGMGTVCKTVECEFDSHSRLHKECELRGTQPCLESTRYLQGYLDRD